MTPSPHRVDAPVEPNPYDPPTHPALRPVPDPYAVDPSGVADPAGYDPAPYDPAPYDPTYDPGAYADPTSEPRTEVIPVVPAQPGPADVDPAADPRIAEAWAAQAEPDLWEHTRTDRSGWESGEWDRPDYPDDPAYPDDPGDPDDPHGAARTAAVQPQDPAPPRRGRVAAMLVPVVVGIAVSVGLGVYGRLHEGTGTALNLAGFSSGLAAKSWLTAAAFVLVLVQLWTSMRMYGRMARTRPAGPRTATLHRWSGRVAVLLTIPVAVHCLYALGYEDSSPRVLLHSLFGCFFYGAFATKMLLLPRRDAPRWALPVFGGLVFVLLSGLFLTSSVWFFSTQGLTF